MADVWIPALLQDLTGGQERIQLAGKTVRQVVDELEQQFPGMKDRLLEGDQLRPGIAVVVDGEISHLRLRHRLTDQSEVHFLPAIRGGC